MGTATAANRIDPAQIERMIAQTEEGVNLKITLRDAKFEAARAEFDLATLDINNLKAQLEGLVMMKRQAESLIAVPQMGKRT